MGETLFKAKRVDSGKWVEGFYYEHKPPLQCFAGENTEKSKHYILQTGFADWGMPRKIDLIEVIPETVGQRVPDVEWYWENEDKTENINDAWLNDVVEIYLKDHTKHVGYLTLEYGCLAIISETLPDGYVWVHEIEDDTCGDLVEDVDGCRYITAKLLGNLFDNKELLNNQENENKKTLKEPEEGDFAKCKDGYCGIVTGVTDSKWGRMIIIATSDMRTYHFPLSELAD
ncbi:MAG: hypothetical protein ACK5MV_13710 [Aminipila sp.]